MGYIDRRRDVPEPGAGAWHRLLVRHVERCPRCVAERAAGERLVEALRELRRERAPEGLLPGVLARIAAEAPRRAPGGSWTASQAAAGARGPGAARMHGVQGLGERWGLGVTLCVLALLMGWVGFVSASHAAGWLKAALALTGSSVLGVISRITDALDAVRAAADLVPTGIAPYVTASFWCAVGVVIALLVMMAAVPGISAAPARERLE